MKIQPMRKKTPVSVHTSWPVQGMTAKRSSPFNLVSRFIADRDQSERNLSEPNSGHFTISGCYQDIKMSRIILL